MDQQEIRAKSGEERRVDRERWRLLIQLERLLELPMVVLGFIWLGLLVMELTVGLSRAFQIVGTVIWGIFIVDFLMKLTVAPKKRIFLARNWLTIIALIVPALRVFRIASAFRFLRFARTGESLRLIRILGSTNRGLRTLRRTMERRSFGYVALASVMIAVIGALAIRALEGGALFSQFGTSLWWTVMLLITLPTGTWPETPEGRILSVILAMYGFAMFGYVTAMLASWFVGQDDEEDEREKEILATVQELREEIAALRAEVRQGQSDSQARRP